jgi:hypothetical protein
MPATPVPTAKLLEQDIAHGEAELRKYQRLVPFWRGRLKQLQGGRPRNYVMYDSIDLAAIPETALAVAGYVDGHWPTFGELVAKFPHAKHLSIAVFARDDAHALDVETGDATPDEAPGWLTRQHGRGVARPWIYANASTWAVMGPILKSATFRRSQYRVWVADWTGQPHLPDGADACQYTDRAMGRNLDASLCLPGTFA